MNNELIKIELKLTQDEILSLFTVSTNVLANPVLKKADSARTACKLIFDATYKYINPEAIELIINANEELFKHKDYKDIKKSILKVASRVAKETKLKYTTPKTKKELIMELQEFALEKRESQALMADEVTKKTIKDIDFIKDQMDSISNEKDTNLFGWFNQTSIANLAYLSLHAPEPYNQKAERILINFISYLLS